MNRTFENQNILQEKEIQQDSFPSDYSLEDEEQPMDSENQDSGQDSGQQQPSGENHKSPLLLLLKMMINPVEGWKAIRRSGLNADEVARGMFYRILAISALACFVPGLYESHYDLNVAVIEAVKVFCAFFFGNFLVLMLAKWTFPKEVEKDIDSDYGKSYVMYLLSTLAIFWILGNCLPMIEPILVFLPLWTIYLAMRGARFFKLPDERRNLLVTLLCLFIIAAPLGIFWCFGLFIKT